MISVLIATHDDEARLGRTLLPLVAAAVDGLVSEVIVADAGSSDATTEIADDAGCRIVSGGLEAARAVAKAPWLLIMAPGARLQPGWDTAAKAHIERGTKSLLRLPIRPGLTGRLAALLAREGQGAVLVRRA